MKVNYDKLKIFKAVHYNGQHANFRYNTIKVSFNSLKRFLDLNGQNRSVFEALVNDACDFFSYVTMLELLSFNYR